MKKLVLAVALSAALVTNGQAASAGPLRVNGAPVDASGSYVHQNTTYVPPADDNGGAAPRCRGGLGERPGCGPGGGAEADGPAG